MACTRSTACEVLRMEGRLSVPGDDRTFCCKTITMKKFIALFVAVFVGCSQFALHAPLRQGAGIEWEILNQEVLELYRTGKYDRAVVVATKALEVAEQNVGPDHSDVAASLNNLAELYRTQGEYAKAETLFNRSLAIWEKALRPDHPDVAQSLNNLALLYESQGEYAKAEPLFNRSLAMREKALGPDHRDVA